jgi:hypothetical protein
MAESPQAGLAIVEGLLGEPALKSYHLLPSVRGDLLQKLGRYDEARVAFEAAAVLADNRRERDLLRRRAAEAADATISSRTWRLSIGSLSGSDVSYWPKAAELGGRDRSGAFWGTPDVLPALPQRQPLTHNGSSAASPAASHNCSADTSKLAEES